MAVPCTVAPRHALTRTLVWVLVLIAVVAGSTGTAAAATTAPAAATTPLTATAIGPVPTGVAGPFTLTFEDTFGGTTLDTSKWSTKEPWNTVGTGFVNDSDALLVSPPPAAHLEVSNDTVKMKARRTTAATNAGKAMQTTMLTSRDKYNTFTHGVVEARIKIPAGNGLWPQLWMQGNSAGGTWPANGEVDIFEFVNNAMGRNQLYGSVHWGADRASHRQATKAAWAPYVGDGQFHTFTLHRMTNFLRFYVDGVQVFQMVPGEAVQNHSTIPAWGVEKETLFDKPHHLRIGLEVGGSWAGQGLSWSQYQEGDLEVDYVRTWAPAAATAPTAPIAPTAAPTVSAGTDVAAHTAGTPLTRTADEDGNGSTITGRRWSIEAGSPAGVWTIIGSATTLQWTPTVPGTYNLRYQATNANGSTTDDVKVVVTAPATSTSTYVQRWTGLDGSPWPAELVMSTVGNAPGTASLRAGRGQISGTADYRGLVGTLTRGGTVPSFGGNVQGTVDVVRSTSGEQYTGFELRRQANGDAYKLEFRGTDLVLYRRIGGVDTLIARRAWALGTTNTRLGFRVDARNAISVKMFPVGGRDPGWTVLATDATPIPAATATSA